MSGPGTIAAQWFPSNEVSTATSICLVGNLIGISAGFLFTPMLVKNHDDLDMIGADLSYMFTIIAGLSTVSLALIIFCKLDISGRKIVFILLSDSDQFNLFNKHNLKYTLISIFLKFVS